MAIGKPILEGSSQAQKRSRTQILTPSDPKISGKEPKALPVFRAVGVGRFAVNCFSAMTYGGRLAILFTGRKSLRSSDLR